MKLDIKRRMIDARDAMLPAIRIMLGPHMSKFSIVVDFQEGTIALHGNPNTKTAGERYFLTNSLEVSKGSHMKDFELRLERIRNFLDHKHKEHLVAA